jgi:hypothetical protein
MRMGREYGVGLWGARRLLLPGRTPTRAGPGLGEQTVLGRTGPDAGRALVASEILAACRRRTWN